MHELCMIASYRFVFDNMCGTSVHQAGWAPRLTYAIDKSSKIELE